MSSTLKSITSITSKTAVRWIKTFATGLLFSIIYGGILLLKLWNHAELNVYLVAAIISLLVFPILYAAIANKIALKTALNLVWENRITGWLSPKISSYIEKIESKQPTWLRNASDAGFVKLKLLETNEADKDSSKWQKRIFSYGLKKARLNDIDFTKENITLSNILSDKIFQAISNITRPSSRLLWICVILHTIVFIAAFVLQKN